MQSDTFNFLPPGNQHSYLTISGYISLATLSCKGVWQYTCLTENMASLLTKEERENLR
jgi:hypothetical protein